MGETNADDIHKDDIEGDESDVADEEEDTSDEDAADDVADDDADDDGKSDKDEPDNDDGDGKKKKADDGKGDDDDDGDEPPTRKPKTNADWVAERRKRALEKARGGKQGKDAAKKGGDADEGDEDEDGLAPEDAEAIDRHLEKRLEPLLKEREETEVANEIAAFTTANPDFKQYATKVAKWATHEAWKNVPIDRIFYAAAGKDLLHIGAKRSKEADKDARKGRTGGGSSDDDAKEKSWADAPLEDVGKEIERIKSGGK